MTTATLILSILLIVCSVLLILVVTLQGDRSANATAVTGDIGNFYNKNKPQTKERLLKNLTISLAIVFVIVAVIVNVIEGAGI